MLGKIGEVIKNAAESFKDFIVDNGTNPVLWVTLFFAGLLVFWATYNSLHKD